MDIRVQRIFIMNTLKQWRTAKVMALACMLASPLQSAVAAESEIKPSVERREVLEDLLDTENFEVGVKVGLISIEDFETSTRVAGHLAYHISEDFYFKAEYAQADAGETSFEKLSNTSPLLTDEERELTYYGLNIGYNLFPGEIFLSDNWAFNSVFSVELGAGSTEFAGDDQFTVNFATNFRVFANDWIAWDIGVSDHIFDTRVTGEAKTTHNLSFTTGVSFYF